MNTLTNFFHMGGYAFYVWMSYGSVLALLAIQLFMPLRRWQKYRKESK